MCAVKRPRFFILIFAIGRFAEFGFLGVNIRALTTTPRNCGFFCKPAAHWFFFLFFPF